MVLGKRYFGKVFGGENWRWGESHLEPGVKVRGGVGRYTRSNNVRNE